MGRKRKVVDTPKTKTADLGYCVECMHWHDKSEISGEDWSGAYFGRCGFFKMETPPMHRCKNWVEKQTNKQ